jgi:hypothetical protein
VIIDRKDFICWIVLDWDNKTRMWFPSTLFEDYSFKILTTSFCPLAAITSIDEMRRLS